MQRRSDAYVICCVLFRVVLDFGREGVKFAVHARSGIIHGEGASETTAPQCAKLHHPKASPDFSRLTPPL